MSPFEKITSDASGHWGCGAFTGTGKWFQYQWPGEWDTVHITVKELLPIVVAVAVWGHRWQGRTVRCLCDNAAVIAIIRSGSSKDPSAMHLLRCLFFFTARYQVVLVASHISGKRNEAGDRLSRDSLSFFFKLVPDAKKRPSVPPQELLDSLVVRKPDWTSPTWSVVLRHIFTRD